MSALDLKNVTKTYGSGHTATHAVNKVSLSVSPGEIVLIMGPSGSGKTTLLTMIGALLQQSSGTITIGDTNLRALDDRTLSKWRLANIGFIFQSFNLLSALTAEQNVAVPLLAAGKPKRQARNRARKLLDQLNLGKRKQALPQDLSGGEKQRVAIARALAGEPKLILADEPTANLDSKIGHEVMMLLCQIACSEGKTVIIVSHDPRLRDIATRVLTIEDGRLTKEEKGDHAKNCPNSHHPALGKTKRRSRIGTKR